MPGPLFNFAAYLGAIIAINAGYFWLTGVAVAWFGLFGPGVALMFAVLPFWQRFRGWQVTRTKGKQQPEGGGWDVWEGSGVRQAGFGLAN